MAGCLDINLVTASREMQVLWFQKWALCHLRLKPAPSVQFLQILIANIEQGLSQNSIPHRAPSILQSRQFPYQQNQYHQTTQSIFELLASDVSGHHPISIEVLPCCIMLLQVSKPTRETVSSKFSSLSFHNCLILLCNICENILDVYSSEMFSGFMVRKPDQTCSAG